MTPADRDEFGHRVEAAERRYRLTNRVTAMAIFCIAAYFGLERLGIADLGLILGAAGIGIMGGYGLNTLLNRRRD